MGDWGAFKGDDEAGPPVSGFNEGKDAAIFVCVCKYCAFLLFGVVAVFWNGGDGRLKSKCVDW